MIVDTNDLSYNHLKTHTSNEDKDSAAVNVLGTFLRSDGRISCNFAHNDKWPNTDGTFEFCPNPYIDRRPMQNFFVQIKGSDNYKETSDKISYTLMSLAFPAFIKNFITSDPGILFVVLNPCTRDSERVFWKYMSVNFLESIKWEQNSITLYFTPEEEIKNTSESISEFCHQLSKISKHHDFMSKLGNDSYNYNTIQNTINKCNEKINEELDKIDTYDLSREQLSQNLFPYMNSFCRAVILLHALQDKNSTVSLQYAWENALLDINTKYLAIFLKGLKYIGIAYPDEDQSERLMLKYYYFLCQIKNTLKTNYNISVLSSLEKFPTNIDGTDSEYFTLVARAIENSTLLPKELGLTRFYIRKITPFLVDDEQYYEVTLQLAGIYATKFDRITAYTKLKIDSNYSIQIGYINTSINFFNININLKVITQWRVSIDPACLNKLGRILKKKVVITSRYREYNSLMTFLTETGINLVDFIDLNDEPFSRKLTEIYNGTNSQFKDILLFLRSQFSKHSKYRAGKHVVRFILYNLHEETLQNVLPRYQKSPEMCNDLKISTVCYPFERNPYIANLAGSRTSERAFFLHILSATNGKDSLLVRPYLSIKHRVNDTGELYFPIDEIATKEEIENYNNRLDSWQQSQGFCIKQENNYVYIDSYEATTIRILQKLKDLTKTGNPGQRNFNVSFLKKSALDFSDNLKKSAIEQVFVNSHLLLIYGAAGTGKTTLLNYISDLMEDRKKLFLTKTHTALQNLQRQIKNPGLHSDFVSIDSATKKVTVSDYSVIFIDECSTIDNRTIDILLNKVSPDSLFVFAGDIYQIESIEFGNWFLYAKSIINKPDACVELLNTWRTKDVGLINLWDEVRTQNHIVTEILSMDGPFSNIISDDLFERRDSDEVVLCLNYDGKFGLNNINTYFQNANKNSSVTWDEWTYKVGDPILFNDTKRFSLLYNNLKGKIVKIEKAKDSIRFTINVERLLTDQDCKQDNLTFIKNDSFSTTISFSVTKYNVVSTDEDDEKARMNSIIPFQLAYAVSIHKAQGLEYNSVKIVIPSINSEKITHGIFYTAITRAKKHLKIYWSAETMNAVINNIKATAFHLDSLEIIKTKLR